MPRFPSRGLAYCGLPQPLADLLTWVPQQVVHVIRHGESEFNAAANSTKSWEDPQVFNPGLTAKGQGQVCAGTPISINTSRNGALGLTSSCVPGCHPPSAHSLGQIYACLQSPSCHQCRVHARLSSNASSALTLCHPSSIQQTWMHPRFWSRCEQPPTCSHRERACRRRS